MGHQRDESRPDGAVIRPTVKPMHDGSDGLLGLQQAAANRAVAALVGGGGGGLPGGAGGSLGDLFEDLPFLSTAEARRTAIGRSSAIAATVQVRFSTSRRT